MKPETWYTWEAFFRAVRRFLFWLITLAVGALWVFFFSCTTYFIVSDTDFFSPLYKSLHRTNLHSGYPLWWATELKNPIPTFSVGTVFLALLFSFPACPFTFFLPCCVSQRCCLVSIPQHHLTDSFPIPPQSSSLQWSLPSTSFVTN